MNDLHYFTSDNVCYTHGSDISLASFNQYINDNFLEYTKEIKFTDQRKTSLVQECIEQALQLEKDYFLITDISKGSNSVDPTTYKCLIPKTDRTCISSNTYEHLIQPVNKLIRDFFSYDDEETINGFTISGDDYSFNRLSNCSTLIYDPNEGQTISGNFAKSGRYIIYKSNFINKISFDKLYNNKNIHELNLNRFNDFPYRIDYLKDKAINFFTDPCKPVSSTASESTPASYLTSVSDYKYNDDTFIPFLNAIKKFEDYDVSMDECLNHLKYDISYIQNVTKYDSIYLKRIEEMIVEKKTKIKNLLGFDGANNGKLSDTKYLKNIKLSENIILFLVIVFIIFAYVKKKI